jgi:hypothetical protein
MTLPDCMLPDGAEPCRGFCPVLPSRPPAGRVITLDHGPLARHTWLLCHEWKQNPANPSTA